MPADPQCCAAQQIAHGLRGQQGPCLLSPVTARDGSCALLGQVLPPVTTTQVQGPSSSPSHHQAELRGDLRVQFTMPVEVNWQFMNKDLMSRFWRHRGPSDHPDKAGMADRILVFHRGVTSVRACPCPRCCPADCSSLALAASAPCGQRFPGCQPGCQVSVKSFVLE